MAITLRDVAGEAVLVAGGPRAILLQLAHPVVGRGVAAHSDFASRPFDRLRATLAYVYAVSLGSDEDRALVRRLVNRAHAPVRGDGYSAFDRDAQLWVSATLYDTALTLYELVFGPVPARDAEGLLREYRELGTTLQVPADAWPASRADFDAYWASQRWQVTGDARRVAADVLRGPRGWGLAMAPLRLLTAGLLPPELRDAYGLPWDARRARRFARLVRAMRAGCRMLPQRVRTAPARRILRRLRADHATSTAAG